MKTSVCLIHFSKSNRQQFRVLFDWFDFITRCFFLTRWYSSFGLIIGLFDLSTNTIITFVIYIPLVEMNVFFVAGISQVHYSCAFPNIPHHMHLLRISIFLWTTLIPVLIDTCTSLFNLIFHNQNLGVWSIFTTEHAFLYAISLYVFYNATTNQYDSYCVILAFHSWMRIIIECEEMIQSILY